VFHRRHRRWEGERFYPPHILTRRADIYRCIDGLWRRRRATNATYRFEFAKGAAGHVDEAEVMQTLLGGWFYAGSARGS
jgi:hypothetical protein